MTARLVLLADVIEGPTAGARRFESGREAGLELLGAQVAFFVGAQQFA